MHTLHQLQSGQLSGTKTLKLSCGLTKLPEEILELADTLELLDVSGNQLTDLPEWFVQLKKLKIAFFSNNNFVEFPAVLGKCPALEMIGFKACKIRTIPEGAIPLNTRWLILTDNQIEALPTSIGKCSRIQKLMLAGNKLKMLPAEMANCQNLELLRISANQIEQFPQWLLSLPRLSWLAFSGNPCSAPTELKEDLVEINWADLELEEQLGEGASGVISKARWIKSVSEKLTQEVAVKIFKGEVTSDGLPQDEMQASLAAGAHPNLVQALGKISQHPEQKQGLVFELIPAGYLNLGGSPSFETCTRDTFPIGTTFSLKEVISISAGIASAAAHLHARCIMHGDLYAHNTLINDAGHSLFGDFGAATIYRTTTSAQAAALERIEVRAFGYFLDDLLTHLAPEEELYAAVSALQQLRQDCLQTETLCRPDFATVSTSLQNLLSHT
ncbi:leucine-rich repeat-containing protein kinase family protein [Rufibacter roseus]|nr:leucine-rich repeat-containing protein kinase family protein [Rufibacter roseus]